MPSPLRGYLVRRKSLSSSTSREEKSAVASSDTHKVSSDTKLKGEAVSLAGKTAQDGYAKSGGKKVQTSPAVATQG
jgi:hypothetical protein